MTAAETRRQPDATTAQRAIARWLFVCCCLVALILAVCGVTRLTRSGLSIVEWEPIVGAVPPLAQADWDELFAEYRESPEYHQVNRGMSLEQFKQIFWWEYFHRLLGRLIGLAYLLPLLYFAWRGYLRSTPGLGLRLTGVLLLGALQGGVGWWMVTSGLKDVPQVSHVRLAIHLGLALLIFAAMLWIALGLLQRPPRHPQARFACLVAVLVYVQCLAGALVAGTRAGYAYNSFPLMEGRWFPADYFLLDGWLENALHNMAAVQFHHRGLAWLIVATTILLVARLLRDQTISLELRRSAILLAGLVASQFVLGVVTLLSRVPVELGAAHQVGAVALFACALWLAQKLGGGQVSA